MMDGHPIQFLSGEDIADIFCMWLLFALQLRASAGRGHKGSTYHAQHQQQRGADFLDKEQ